MMRVPRVVAPRLLIGDAAARHSPAVRARHQPRPIRMRTSPRPGCWRLCQPRAMTSATWTSSDATSGHARRVSALRPSTDALRRLFRNDSAGRLKPLPATSALRPDQPPAGRKNTACPLRAGQPVTRIRRIPTLENHAQQAAAGLLGLPCSRLPRSPPPPANRRASELRSQFNTARKRHQDPATSHNHRFTPWPDPATATRAPPSSSAADRWQVTEKNVMMNA